MEADESRLELQSRITDVTVFRSGALVTRLAPLEGCSADTRIVALPGLPLSLRDASIRCAVRAPGVLATDVRTELTVPTPIAEEDAPAAELAKAEAEVTRLRARLAFLEECIGFDAQLGPRGQGEPGSPPVPSPLAARRETLRLLQTRLETLHQQRGAHREMLRVAELRLRELRAQQALQSSEQSAKAESMQKRVVVAVQGSGLSAAAGSALELQYFIPGARWAPSYSVRLASDMRSAELAMRAMVCQRTGEDWDGVALTLSTAEHQQWAELPELMSRRIGRKQAKPPRRGFRAPPQGAELLYADYDGGFAGAPPIVPPVSPQTAPLPQPAPEFDALEMDDAEEGRLEDEVLAGGAMSSEFFGAQAEVAVPPPPSAPMPMPMMAKAASAAPGAAPMRSRSKKRAKAEVRKELLQDKGGRGGGGAALPEPLPSEPDASLLAYGQLRMPGPDGKGRGCLKLASRMEVYAEAFADAGSALGASRRSELARAETQARDLAALPTGHVSPWSEHFDYAYRADKTASLASDGQYHSVPITSASASGTPLHIVVPRESTDVFRTVSVENPLASPLLPGPLDVYWDDTFLLTSELALTAPKGSAQLGLGVDQSVKVVRNSHFREETTGLMGGSLTLSHKIVIEVANESGAPVSLEVRERIPVAASDEDDIQVDLKSVSPPWSRKEADATAATKVRAKGVHAWTVELAAAERAELTATYDVRLPSKYELRGGNRREW